jgi:hypothetical protein
LTSKIENGRRRKTSLFPGISTFTNCPAETGSKVPGACKTRQWVVGLKTLFLITLNAVTAFSIIRFFEVKIMKI